MLVEFLSLPLAEVMIAYAPGAVDAMMLLALALNLDPVYVGAHHVDAHLFRVADDAAGRALAHASQQSAGRRAEAAAATRAVVDD